MDKKQTHTPVEVPKEYLEASISIPAWDDYDRFMDALTEAVSQLVGGMILEYRKMQGIGQETDQ